MEGRSQFFNGKKKHSRLEDRINRDSSRDQQMNSVKIARENRSIIREGFYNADGEKVAFQHSLSEHQEVKVITPEEIHALIKDEENWSGRVRQSENPHIEVINADSFSAHGELVMNFANAYHPGGGYLRGASAQEETLCAESTLYESISSEEAAVMYEANNKAASRWLTEYMLISPCVEIFRDQNLRRLHQTYTKAVLTIAAPNISYDPKMRNVPQAQIDTFMLSRLHQFFDVAAYYGYRTLTLGAWGCGAFGHDAKRVAEYFKETLLDRKMICWFDSVTFAIYSSTSHSYNLDAFLEKFGTA